MLYVVVVIITHVLLLLFVVFMGFFFLWFFWGGFLMLLGLFVFLLACLHYISLIYFQCDEVTEDCQEYDVL